MKSNLKTDRIIKEILEPNDPRESIFWETEVRANRLTAWGMLGVALFLAQYCMVMILDDWGYDAASTLFILGIELVLLMPLGVYCLLVKGRKHWLKLALLMACILATIELQISFPLEALILLLLPVVLSSQYFSVRLTRTTAIAVGVLFVVAVWASIRFGIAGDYDMNYYMLPAGTVLSVEEDTWLATAIFEKGIDPAYLMPAMMTSSVPSKLFVYALVSSVCVAVARRGRKMVLQEVAASAERASIETELSLAAQIQLSALPTKFPAFPDNHNVDLYATMSPAKEVGGDFYDFFPIDHDHIAIAIADVSDKGVPAAMFMMTAKSQIKDFAQQRFEPSEVFNTVNAQLCANNKAELFITAWLGVLEVSTGKLTYVNAGHCRPLLRRKETGEFCPLDVIHGLPLACFDDMKYPQSCVQFSAGDEIYLYTDGVTEATAPSGEMYGTERLVAYLNTHASEPLQEILPALRKDIDTFVNGAAQFDDITMLMLRLEET